MGQYWKIHNVDAQEELPNDAVKLGPILYGDTAASIVPYLIALPPPVHSPYLKQAADQTTASLLSAELLTHIISFLVPAERICQSVTCRALLGHLYADVTRLPKKDAAPWAGDRIITLGDYAETLPPNLLTSDELTELEDAADDVEFDGLYTLGKCNTMFNQVTRTLNVTEQKIISTLRPLMPPTTSTDSSQQPEDWILRNLTKRQYVRASVLARLCPESPADGPFIEPVGFGELIISKTAWTLDPPGTEWAGDRFDIIPFSDFVKEDAWKDVSILSARALHQNLMDKIHECRYRNRQRVRKERGEDTDGEEEDAWQDEYAWLEKADTSAKVQNAALSLRQEVP